MNRKIIFLDCDGTIIDVPRGLTRISDNTIYAIKELVNNGHLVFITSGRARCLLPDYIKEIEGINYITTNGAYSYLNDGTLIANHVFPNSLIKKINKYCNDNGLIYFDEGQHIIHVVDLNDPLFMDFVNNWKVSLDAFGEYEEGHSYNMMMIAFKDENSANKFYEEFKDETDAYPQYGFNSCDLNYKGVNKGTGVKDVLEYFNIDKDDAYAFGDGLNDYQMLMSVTNGYMMANGNIKLKEATSLTAPDVLEDGFYQIMVKEGLIKEKH